MFKSRCVKPVTIPYNIGDGFDSVFEERIVEGVTQLVKVGENPLNEFVQKSLDETLISNILRKFESGNVDVINKTNGVFLDVSSMPSNLMEAQNLMIKTKSYFEKLPVEVREKFGHSYDTFLQKYMDGFVADLFPTKEIEVEPIDEGGKKVE